MIEEGYFEYGNFEFENGLFRKTKWGTKNTFIFLLYY